MNERTGRSPDAPRSAVFWDFDGTLASREGNWSAAVLSSLDRLDRFHAVQLDDIKSVLHQGFPWHAPGEGHAHLDTADKWWAHLGAVITRALVSVGVDRRTAAAAAVEVRDEYLDPRAWTVLSGVPEALGILTTHHFENYILSNHVPELPVLVGRLGLSDYFTGIISSAHSGWEKPNPRAFRYARELAQQPTMCIMIGDNPVADYEGAQAAGFDAYLIRPGEDRTRVLERSVHEIVTTKANLRHTAAESGS